MRLLSRRSFFKTLAGSAAGVLGLGGYAFAIEPGFLLRVRPYALTPPGWTPGLRLRLAILADLHAGMPSMPISRVRHIVEVTNALNPDLVLLLGDYSNSDHLLGIQLAFRLGRGRHQGMDDLAGALAKVSDDAPAILLAHEPDIFPKVPARVALTLSGHTHGGQVRLPGVPLVVPSNYGARYAHGHVVEDGRHLVVSAGLGTSGLPVRFGVPPEIVLV